MDIFISWSGEKSKVWAEFLENWLKIVLQATKPWLSTRGVESGSGWNNTINRKLASTRIGILCMTKENLDSKWIHFEAGALLKGLDENRICTLLIDLKPSDITSPLSQFNNTVLTKTSIKKLLTDINRFLDEDSLPSHIFEQAFETNWPAFETKISEKYNDDNDITFVQRSEREILDEILLNVRGLTKQNNKTEFIRTKQPIYSGSEFKSKMFQAMEVFSEGNEVDMGGITERGWWGIFIQFLHDEYPALADFHEPHQLKRLVGEIYDYYCNPENQ